MNVYLAGALSGLSYISYPITILLYSILLAVLWLANVLYGPVAAFLQPFIFIILCIWRVVALPFRLLAQLEPLYNFIGAGVITGVLIGLGLNYLLKRIDASIDFDWIRAQLPQLPTGPGIKEYRTLRQKEHMDPTPLASPGYLSLSDGTGSGRKNAGRRGLSSQVILEEVDSDF